MPQNTAELTISKQSPIVKMTLRRLALPHPLALVSNEENSLHRVEKIAPSPEFPSLDTEQSSFFYQKSRIAGFCAKPFGSGSAGLG
jgi:hypothetical protein